MKYSCFTTLLFLLFTSALHAQYNLTEISQVNYPVGFAMSGCWGYTDTTGNEYAIIGTSKGTSIVDITIPTLPEELFFIPGGESIWREAKVWNNHAYISTEAANEGMMIIDLNNLPFSIDTVRFKGDALHPFSTAHTLFIDEFGYCYLFGYNIATGESEGAYIVDLNPDPQNPLYVSSYTNFYIHDGFVRDNILWAAEVYEGKIEVLDVNDKSDIELIGTQTTGAGATHNCWLSDDNKYLFTTDEINYGFIESYDVTDLTDIQFLDAIKHGADDSTTAHNVYYLNGYLVTAHYTEGVTIHDAHKPDNLIEVGYYDTTPFGPNSGYTGVWGVYPYFNSQNIIATDRVGTVFILQPNYQRAAYLEGTVKDLTTGGNVFNAQVKILATPAVDYTNLIGEFKTGYYAEGNYTVEINRSGCISKTFNDINLISGETYILDALLDCPNIAIEDAISDISLNTFYSAENNVIETNYAINNGTTLSVLLYNSAGQLLERQEISNAGKLPIPTTQLCKGCYFITFSNSNFAETKQIIIY